jgi:hypothetical protein
VSINPIWINYALLAQFAALAIGWGWHGDIKQSIYWIGAFICTAGVTL